MLYDAALQSARHGARRDGTARHPARRAALSRTLAIVAELQNTLDLERGGKIATDLDRLYAWVDLAAARRHRPAERPAD